MYFWKQISDHIYTTESFHKKNKKEQRRNSLDTLSVPCLQCYNMMERGEIIKGWQSSKLQQTRTSPNTAALDAKTREENLPTFEKPPRSKDIQQNTYATTANP